MSQFLNLVREVLIKLALAAQMRKRLQIHTGRAGSHVIRQSSLWILYEIMVQPSLDCKLLQDNDLIYVCIDVHLYFWSRLTLACARQTAKPPNLARIKVPPPPAEKRKKGVEGPGRNYDRAAFSSAHSLAHPHQSRTRIFTQDDPIAMRTRQPACLPDDG